MTNEELKAYIEARLRKAGWEITDEKDEDGATICRAVDK